MRHLTWTILTVFLTINALYAQDMHIQIPLNLRALTIYQGDIWLMGRNSAYVMSDDEGYERQITIDTMPEDALVTDCIADNKANLWVTTRSNGLHKYNGSRWVSIDDSDGLSSQFLYCIDIDKNGTIWVGGRDVSSFDGDTWETHTPSVNAPEVHEILADDDGGIWCNTLRGLQVLRDGSWEFYSEETGLSAPNIYGLAKDGNGDIWVCAYDNMIKERDEEKDVFIYTYHYYLQRFDGESWIVEKEVEGTSPNPPTLIQPIGADSENRMWYLDGQHFSNTTNTSSISRGETRIVRNSTVDDQGRLWMLIENYANYGGINLYQPDTPYKVVVLDYVDVQEPEKIYPSQVWINRLFERKTDNTTWIISGLTLHIFSGDATSLFSDNEWRAVPIPYSRIVGAYMDEEGVLWCSVDHSPDTRLASFNGDIWREHEFSLELPKPPFAMARDRDGVFWYGYGYAKGGVSSYDGETITHYSTADGLHHEQVLTITVDDDNVKWFDTRNGICSFDGSIWTTHESTVSWAKEITRSALLDDQGNKWFISGGLWRHDGTEFRNFTTDDGLPDKTVQCLTMDMDNNVMVGTSTGLAVFNGKTFDPVETFAGKSVQQTWVTNNIMWMRANYVIHIMDIPIELDVDEDPVEAMEVLTSYPNPFNATTTITYSLRQESPVTLSIYNVTGQRVRHLTIDRMSAGKHRYVWDGISDSGGAVSSGVYIARVSADNTTQTAKMLLLR